MRERLCASESDTPRKNMPIKTIAHIDWNGQVAVLRSDLNVPMRHGQIADETRLTAALPTMESILAGGGGVLVLSHLGRPKAGEITPEFSLAPVAEKLATMMNRPVAFFPSLADAHISAGEIGVLENIRFHAGERENAPALAHRYAEKGDIFVMDAFATAHRAEASVVGVAEFLPACAGLLVAAELAALEKTLTQIERPLVGVFGGAKISTKLPLLRRMATLCDTLIVGGGIANTLLLAQGHPVGQSLIESHQEDNAQALQNSAQDLLLPETVVVATQPDAATGKDIPLSGIGTKEMILDIGAKTRQKWCACLRAAKTILWNGPVGLFEQPPFAAGTEAIAKAIATSPAFSLAGGGDTLAAARHFGVLDQISHVSTAGGALLSHLAGESLPGLAKLPRQET